MSSEKNIQSDQFEKELDEFFKERAEFRSTNFSDKSKHKSSCERDEDDKQVFDPTQMSGCCMTGCSDCPWLYGREKLKE